MLVEKKNYNNIFIASYIFSDCLDIWIIVKTGDFSWISNLVSVEKCRLKKFLFCHVV